MIFLVVAAVAGVALVGASIYLNAAPAKTASMTGTLFITSAGRLDGGAASYTARYNVTLAATSGTGTMNLTLLANATDLVPQHEFVVTDFVVTPNNLTMSFRGGSVNLGWINNSTVLTSANGTYTAAWGPSAPPGQVWGSIAPSIFGVPSSYYVILSVSVPSQPVDTIPFVAVPLVPSSSRPAL
ncbi:MAG: hypothetical protein ABSF83_04975 [Nitrososphaerales archaeon]|jgi:hypothetical protein